MTANRPSAVTIGAYDGVHLGHRRVIDSVRSIAHARGLLSVVVTFDRHPAAVVRPESAPKLLTDLAQKLELLNSTGVDDVVVVRFDEERSSVPAEEFVDQVLVRQLSCRCVVVGKDFHFGKGRGGNVELLEAMGADLGFDVVPFALVSDAHGEVVSSTRIRTLISAGQLAEAAEMLGRPHEVRGSVAPSTDAGADAGLLRVEVPIEILRPPPGRYEVLAGPEGEGGELARADVLVRSGDGDFFVGGSGPGALEPVEAPLGGARLRLLFPGSA